MVGDRAQLRISAWAIAAVALVLAAAGVFLVTAHRRTLTDKVDDLIRQRAGDIAALVTRGDVPARLPGEGDDSLAQLVGPNGRVVAASANLGTTGPVAGTAGADERIRTVDNLPIEDGDEFRLLSRRVPGPGGPYGLHVAGEAEDVADSVLSLARALVVAFTVVLALIGALIWKIVGRTLRPVEEAHRRQARFVADASHELRSPLATIRSELEVDLAHPEDAHLVATHRSVLEEVERLSRLIDDLLYLARTDAGALPLRAETVNLDEVALQEARGLRARAAAAVDTGRVSGAQVSGDPDQLARAVRNLLDNAARHAASRVTVSLQENGDSVVLAVADDGPGVPAEQAASIFERFVRADGARDRDHGGAGLGLAITAEIVGHHGGTIRVGQGAGSGGTFVVTLPRAR